MHTNSKMNHKDKDHTGFSAAVYKHLSNYFATLDGDPPVTNLYKLILQEIEKPLLSAVLEHTEGNNAKAAAILGINRNTLRKKVLELNLVKE